MKRIPILLAALLGLFLAAGAAQAATDAFTTGNVNLRTGPSARHARITTIPSHAGVVIYGCTRSWCDVGWAGYRGWVSARYLDQGYYPVRRRHYVPPRYEPYVVGPVIGFHFGSFWPHYHQPYYHHRPHIVHKRHVRVPRPQVSRHWNHRGQKWHRGGRHGRNHRY